jgi:putative flippase GtrA
MMMFARYLLVGVLNTGVGYAIIFLCMYGLGLSPEISNALGYGLGMVISYTANRVFTFGNFPSTRATMLRFAMVNGVAYLANLGMLVLLVRGLGIHEGLSQVLAGGVYVVTSFLMNKHYVFRAPDLGSGANG